MFAGRNLLRGAQRNTFKLISQALGIRGMFPMLNPCLRKNSEAVPWVWVCCEV